MSASIKWIPPENLTHEQQPAAHAVASDWKKLYLVGGAASLLSVVCIVVAVVVFVANPPPTMAADWFALFQRNGVLGLFDLDLMMLTSYALMGVVYLALYGALRRANEPFMLLATVAGFVSIATYIASNPAFGMLYLSNQYASATSAAERTQLLAAGQATLASWQGSAYNVSYVLGGIAALIIAVVMLRSEVFSKATAYVGIVLGVMMLLPADAGPVGLVVSLVSLVPTAIWLILIALRLFEFGRSTGGAPAYSLELRLSKDHR